MPLTLDELDACYSTLADAARKHELDWVVDQVESQIALGKITIGKVRAKEVPLRNTPEDEAARMAKGRPTKFTLSEEYSAEEKLKILIEAVRHAVRGVWEVAAVVSTSLSENISALDAVQFMPEGISKESFRLDVDNIEARRRSVVALDALLHELEEAI